MTTRNDFQILLDNHSYQNIFQIYTYVFFLGTNGHPSLYSGLLVLLGLMVFVSVEKIFSGIGADHVDDLHSPKIEKVNNNTKELKQSGDTKSNGYVKNGVKPSKRKSIDSSDKKKHVSHQKETMVLIRH